ncbi:hypothetical protein TIFTF001_000260 [Ficus carica]|uniref:Uncharacterized protein n=1 Tax=Ficus carica TaxID=3494 RepID=A0AA87Z3Z9_FICCA|nr:hypothetical protein TIFTF001_000260 [Ficus carica]
MALAGCTSGGPGGLTRARCMDAWCPLIRCHVSHYSVAGVGVSASSHRVVEGMYALTWYGRQSVQGGGAVATWTGQFKRGSTVIGDGIVAQGRFWSAQFGTPERIMVVVQRGRIETSVTWVESSPLNLFDTVRKFSGTPCCCIRCVTMRSRLHY